nr:macrophage mannose receptor 1-like isoform X1 [Leptinotarsa decemlineata]
MWFIYSCLLILLFEFQVSFAAIPVDSSSYAIGRRRYYIGLDKVPCNQAVEICRRKSMRLASIRNERENNDVYRFLSQQNYNGGAFISAKILSYGNAWSWLDGTLVNYFNWNSGEPNGYDETERCVQVFIKKNTLVWDDHSTIVANSYICESMTDDDNIQIDNGIGKKYYLGNEKVTYFGAIQYCEDMYMTLASVRNAEENSALHHLILTKGIKGHRSWISANQRVGSTNWLWLNGSDVEYFNWDQGKPSNEGLGENCITVSEKEQQAKWVDAPCDEKNYAVCEKLDSKKPDSQRNIFLDVKTSDLSLKLNIDRK